MSDEAKKSAEIPPQEITSPVAWQPFTPRGVALFAQAPLSRILFLQLIVAVLAAVVVTWFIYANYFPSISDAIEKLPDAAVLQDGGLTNVGSGILTEKHFLSVVVDLEETAQTGRIADLQMELRQNHFQICSLFGCAAFDYPKRNIPLGRSTADPWWGARQPIILMICGVLAFAQVWLSWIILALIYTPIAKLIAYLNDRQLSLGGSWRLASAAQLTGALVMILTIVFYGIQAFDLIRFLFFFILHFLLAWIYLCASLYFLPRISVGAVVTKNPFN